MGNAQTYQKSRLYDGPGAGLPVKHARESRRGSDGLQCEGNNSLELPGIGGQLKWEVKATVLDD